MKIKELKNPDMIQINGAKFQVAANKSLFFNTAKQELEMAVELVKVGDKVTTPDFRLTYTYERPDVVKFFEFNKKSNHWKEIPISDFRI
jgi:hypothetical protein